MDAKEQLLISEGVCHQLGIVKYHKEVMPGDNDGKDKSVLSVRVQLVQTIEFRPEESVVTEVRLVWRGADGDGLCYGGGVPWSQREIDAPGVQSVREGTE